MLVLKIAPVLLLALAVGAEKKIELEDIEEDNLKSEKEKDVEKVDDDTSGLLPLEFLKNGLLRYFETPTHSHQPQQPRYVQQYAVTEPPERPIQPQPTASPKTEYGPPGPQRAMVGYLSNVPMQIYLVPQLYNDQPDQGNAQASVQYTAPASPRFAYPTAPEAVQTQANYIEVPTYIAPTAKTYVQQAYSPPVAYFSYSQPTAATHTTATVAPVVTYQMPVQVQYPSALAAPPASKGYYQNVQYPENNAVEETLDNEEEQKQYATRTEAPYTKSPDYRYYTSPRQPSRDEYRHSSVSELPPPNPLLLKAPPPHLAHIPKALPMYRPLNKPVYSGSGFIPNYTPRPHDAFGLPFKRRPNSLLDSYIPSSLQYEYLKRGYTKDPLVLYDALASGRHFHHAPPVTPRHYERGFLPNQMYHTAGGGITYGHYKRSPPKVEKSSN